MEREEVGRVGRAAAGDAEVARGGEAVGGVGGAAGEGFPAGAEPRQVGAEGDVEAAQAVALGGAALGDGGGLGDERPVVGDLGGGEVPEGDGDVAGGGGDVGEGEGGVVDGAHQGELVAGELGVVAQDGGDDLARQRGTHASPPVAGARPRRGDDSRGA